jgi:hypothetical protein
MRARLTLASFICCTAVSLSTVAPSHAQTWQTAANHVGDDRYFLPPYPVVFVAARVNEIPSSTGIDGSYHIGTDVLSANNPDRGHHLWIIMPDGAVKKLFPLPAHQQVAGLIDTPLGQLGRASVVEPNLSEDGTRIYFSYFHDTTVEASSSFGLHRLPLKGADLYVLDLTDLLIDPSVDPAALPVTRLTFRTYAGNGAQTAADRNKAAMNQTLASSTGPNDWGTVYMHAVEMRTAAGLKLVYVSDERRLQNSNQPMSIGEANHNFNLHIADIAADGTLSAARQFQYYTTTSALSPTPLRNGIAFSYQASTADARNWHIQGMNSAGRWYPILGYGTNPELFHLGAFCVRTTGNSPGDYFVGARYYNFNNEGFGSLWAQNLAQAGLNTYDVSTSWGIVPRQVGSYKVTNGVTSNDYPSAKVGNQYIGKMTTPRCGYPDELFMAYSPTSANGRLLDNEGNRSIYHSYIAYRPNLAPFHPLDPINVAAQTGLRIVVDDSSDAYTLVWPVPVLPWDERTGDAQQRFARGIADPRTTIAPGLPYAQVGTSALYNTDRKPFDCWLGPSGQTPYSPNKPYTNINQENDLIVDNTDGLTYVQNQSNFCEPLSPTNVLGVAINLTSNKTNLSAGFNPGYTTDGNGKKEAAKLLGVYDVRSQADQSFLATIPANAPFELQLLHRRYGLKLADVRSWHSLQPRETRNNCGGCHQHQPGQAIPFAGTTADQQPPLDMVGATPFLRYDGACTPTLRWTRLPTRAMPEWKADIWPGFDQHCGNCHNSSRSSDTMALAALDYVDESSAYNRMRFRNYANSLLGALGSPAWWAARGERTDGRRNDLAKYQPNYAAGQWGFRFSAVHATDPGLCNQNDAAVAQWVYRFGQWIDNHMPRDTGAAYGWKHDWYHPSVDAALSAADCSLTDLRVGFWDDSGSVAELLVSINDAVIVSHTNYRNGAVFVPLAGVTATDTVQITLRDYADNRQMYARRIVDLQRECLQQPQVTPVPASVRRQRLRPPRS